MECDIFTLNKKFYQTLIFNDYPEIEKQLRELAIEREAKINETISKARKVLETLGIEDALMLPSRYAGKRTSIGSMNTSIKKRMQFEKEISMKKIAFSFENAANNKSMTASEFSKKAMVDKQELKSEGSPKKLVKQEESSSSGDFNIWGGAEESGSNGGSHQEAHSESDENNNNEKKNSSRRQRKQSTFGEIAK